MLRRTRRAVGNAKGGAAMTVADAIRQAVQRDVANQLRESRQVHLTPTARKRRGQARWRRLPTITRETFWEYVLRGDPDECWPWLGRYTTRGETVLSIDGQERRAQRI